MRLIKQDKVGIIACSDPIDEERRRETEELIVTLNEMGLEVILSPFLYAIDTPLLGRGKLCGEVLMNFYRDPLIKAIFDISGGNTANEVLNYLDFDEIRQNPKPLFGYSDMTCVLNGIYSKTSLKSVLYSVRNICRDKSGTGRTYFQNFLFQESNELFGYTFHFVQGHSMEGIVVGGNIRCLLKLSGTPYFPDMTDKILLLESLSGEALFILSLLNQLKQMGVFHKLKGILLGTFTALDKMEMKPDILDLVTYVVDKEEMPIAITKDIGHSRYSLAITIGEYIKISRC